MFAAYCGSTGEGKTIEVVEHVIIPGVASGRRVLTNVAGLDVDAIKDYCIRELDAAPDKLGEIVTFRLSESKAGKFANFLEKRSADDQDEEAVEFVQEGSLIRPGDLIVLDEVWRIWRSGAKIHPNDEMLWRMHRHIIHPQTGVSCDLVLVTQNFADLHRTLKGLVHERYQMSKLRALGLSKRYRVDIYSGGSKKPVRSIQRGYNEKIFPLYKSHSMGAGVGKELNIDGRGNLFKGPLFMVALPCVFVLAMWGAWRVYKFFTPSSQSKTATEPEKSASTAPTANSVPGKSPGPIQERYSNERIVGYVASPSGVILFIDTGLKGLRQVLADDKVVIFGQYVEFQADGKTIGTFTGEARKQTGIGPIGQQ